MAWEMDMCKYILCILLLAFQTHCAEDTVFNSRGVKDSKTNHSSNIEVSQKKTR